MNMNMYFNVNTTIICFSQYNNNTFGESGAAPASQHEAELILDYIIQEAGPPVYTSACEYKIWTYANFLMVL